MEIKCYGVNDGLSQGLRYLMGSGRTEQSRNGPVLAAPEPVSIHYSRPWERVLFSPTRNANPFFHLFEALWMLAGRNDVAFPSHYNSKFGQFSDDGTTFNGAYGFRWRKWFDRDQLKEAIAELQKDKETRRVVVGMWDPMNDLGSKSKDIPCNTHIYFDCRGGVLNMTVCNRSNDAIWGAFGANAVHMSVLQEYVAAMIKMPIGRYTQFTNNLHVYTDIFSNDYMTQVVNEINRSYTVYEKKEQPRLIMLMNSDPDLWHADLEFFMENYGRAHVYHDPFFGQVAGRMAAAWEYRHERFGRELAEIIADDAWRVACCEWLDRAAAKRNVTSGS